MESFINVGRSMNSSDQIQTTPRTLNPREDPLKIPPQMTDDNFLINDRIDSKRVRYPHCLVWTPIPVLTWLFPFIGHMGIARTDGVIRDFAGPYYVSVNMQINILQSLSIRYLGR